MRSRASAADVVAALPTTSVMEFRTAAWPILDDNLNGIIVMRLYFTWAALTVGVLVLALGLGSLVSLVVGAFAWWIVAVGVLVTWLASRRIRHQFQRGAEIRRRIDTQSRRIDSMAERGQIPVTPPGWEGRMQPAPQMRGSSWM